MNYYMSDHDPIPRFAAQLNITQERHHGGFIKQDRSPNRLSCCVESGHTSTIYHINMALMSLPNEIQLEIAKYLTQSQIYALICTNRRLFLLLEEHLLKHNIQHRHGNALLHMVNTKNLSRARRLIDLGADVNKVYDMDGENACMFKTTLLHLVAMTDDVEKAQLLFSLGAQIGVRDKYGRAALHWALEGRHEKMIYELSGRIDDMGTFLVDQERKLTPLHYAARLGLLDMIKYYVDIGLNINVRDSNGDSPLLLAQKSFWRGRWKQGVENGERCDLSIEIWTMLGEDPVTAYGLALVGGKLKL